MTDCPTVWLADILSNCLLSAEQQRERASGTAVNSIKAYKRLFWTIGRPPRAAVAHTLEWPDDRIRVWLILFFDFVRSFARSLATTCAHLTLSRDAQPKLTPTQEPFQKRTANLASDSVLVLVLPLPLPLPLPPPRAGKRIKMEMKISAGKAA